MRKVLLTLSAFSALFMFSCEQPDSETDESETNTDSSQYVSFIVTGGAYSNAFINIDKGMVKTTNVGIDSNVVNAGISVLADSTSQPTSVVFIFNGGQSPVAAGEYTLGTNVTASIQMLGTYHLTETGGMVTITEFPDSVGKYLVGTFNGTFHNAGDTITEYTLTNGKFRLQRKN